MTSPETVLNGNSVKTKLYNTPPPYVIVLASSVKILEVKAIEFHRIQYICFLYQTRYHITTRSILEKNSITLPYNLAAVGVASITSMHNVCVCNRFVVVLVNVVLFSALSHVCLR